MTLTTLVFGSLALGSFMLLIASVRELVRFGLAALANPGGLYSSSSRSEWQAAPPRRGRGCPERTPRHVR